MSSAGIISKVHSPMTTGGEVQRKVSNAIQGIPGPQEQMRRVAGIVTKVHPTKPRFVQARNAFDGSPIASFNWIELNHSAQEIAERWGTIRPGFRIRVTFFGPAGQSADASVTGTESQKLEEPHQVNEAARGLYAIFAPGTMS